MLRFAPLQLAAQDLEIGLPRRLDELQQFLTPGDANYVRCLQRDASLPIERQKDRFRVSGKFHLNGRRIPND